MSTPKITVPVAVSDIPNRCYAAIAAARMDAIEGHDGGSGVILDYEPDLEPRAWIVWNQTTPNLMVRTTNRLTLPATDHNTCALAAILARSHGLDVSGGVVASYESWEAVGVPGPVLMLAASMSDVYIIGTRPEFDIVGWPEARDWVVVPEIIDIDPTQPDALFKALVAALRGLPA